MRNILAFFVVVLLVLTVWNCNIIPGKDLDELTPAQQAMVDELNGLIHRISGASPGLPDGELNVLDYLSDARIVGLGEATHGTKDFFQMKHRVFKYLVEHHGFRAFGFEADFAESIYLDRCITTGEGDLRQLMKNYMHFWVWETEEVYQLLEWMREYNRDKPRDRMIRYVGVDCQFQTYQGDLLIEYLETVSPSFLAGVRAMLEDSSSLNYTAYDTMTQGEWENWQVAFQSVYDQLVNRENAFVQVSGREEYEIAKQLARTLIQTHQVSHSYSLGSGNVNYRDGYMAENSLWLADFMGEISGEEDAKVVLWAHNAHVGGNDNNLGYDMGFQLKDALGEKYQVVGFSFAYGGFNAVWKYPDRTYGGLRKCSIITRPPSDSANYLFFRVEEDNFILLMDRLSPDMALTRWLSAPRPFILIGAGYDGFPTQHYYDTHLYETFDVIIHFNETTAADILQ